MLPLSSVLVLAFLALASSQKYPLKQPNQLTTGEKLLSDVQAHDLKGSETTKKKGLINTVKAVTGAKYGALKGARKSDKLLSTAVDVELTKLEAIRAIKLTLLNMLSAQINALIDEIQNNDVIDLLESPIFDFVAETLVPLLSERNNEKDEMNDGNIVFPDLQSSDSTWLHKNLKTSMTHEDVPGKSTLASMEPLFEEPLLPSSRELPARRVSKS